MKNTSLFTGVQTLCEVIVLFFLWIIYNPGKTNCYGHYEDAFDLPRYEGFKGTVFNWFTCIIEPVTEGKYSLNDIPFMLTFMGWMVLSLAVACIMIKSSAKKSKLSCPWCLTIGQTLVTLFWAAYIITLWLS